MREQVHAPRVTIMSVGGSDALSGTGAMFILMLLIAHCIAWYLVLSEFTTNSSISSGIAMAGILSPVVVSWMAWRLVRGGWFVNVDPSLPKAIWLRRCRRRCIGTAVLFTFVLSIFSGAMRHMRQGAVSIHLENDGRALAQAADSYAKSHSGAYPRTFAELKEMDYGTLADNGHFEYFGDGMTSRSPQGVVVLASTENLDDGSHLLITNDEQETWVGPVGFPIIHHFLVDHVPVTEWKNAQSATMP